MVSCSESTENSTILPSTPRFVVLLPDSSLLCFSIDGYELFAYNLITSNFFILNGFLNLTTIPTHKDEDHYTQTRGFGDIGVIVKAIDKRIRGGRRYFKHLIYGEKKKAIMDGFGEVDMKGGAIVFTLRNGLTNIESVESPHDKFRLILDKPKSDVTVVSTDGHTFNVYVEDNSGFKSIDVHGLIGECVLP